MTILEACQATRVPFDQEDIMPTTNERVTHREPWRIPAWLGLCRFLAIAAFFKLKTARDWRTLDTPVAGTLRGQHANPRRTV